MGLKHAFAIGAAGLSAQRTRMETLASNLANARTTRTAGGGPYRRQIPVFPAEHVDVSFQDTLGRALRSVRVERIAEDHAH